MSEKNIVTEENAAHCAAIIQHSRNSISIAENALPSEIAASVKESVTLGGAEWFRHDCEKCGEAKLFLDSKEREYYCPICGRDRAFRPVEKSVEFAGGGQVATVSTPKASTDVETTPTGSIASESGHWYLPDGTPFYFTERRSGPLKGEKRAVSLRHDRKLLLSLRCAPSVTTVMSVLDKPGLLHYRARKMFEAVIELARKYETIRDGDETLFSEACDLAEEHRRTAAERGTALHGAIERYIRGELPGPEWDAHVGEVVAALAQYGLVFGGEPERSFAHDCGVGVYGGKVDYHEQWGGEGEGEPTQPGLVIDFKSKEEITDEQLAGKDKLVYDEHAMQLAAYREGLLMPDARCINVFVGEKDKRVFIYEHTQSDLKRAFRLFQAVLKVWKIKNNYYVKL